MNWLLAIASGAATAWGLFRLLFEGWDDFMECVRFWLTPDVVSWFRGEGAEDWWSELRLGLWLGGSFGAGWGGHLLGHWLFS